MREKFGPDTRILWSLVCHVWDLCSGFQLGFDGFFMTMPTNLVFLGLSFFMCFILHSKWLGFFTTWWYLESHTTYMWLVLKWREVKAFMGYNKKWPLPLWSLIKEVSSPDQIQGYGEQTGHNLMRSGRITMQNNVSERRYGAGCF